MAPAHLAAALLLALAVNPGSPVRADDAEPVDTTVRPVARHRLETGSQRDVEGGEVGPADTTVRFDDRTEAAGLDVVTWSGGPDKDHILESAGNGVLVNDYDLDGRRDLYFVNAYRFFEDGRRQPHANALYRNGGDGAFPAVAAAAGVDAALYGSGGCVGDVDGDGLPDLYVTVFGANLLYRNNGDGTFTEIAGQAGVDDPGWGTGAVFLDADGDGDQDLYVANYIVTDWERVEEARRHRMWRGRVAVLDGPRGLTASADVFYRNEGDGTFTEVTDEAGFGSSRARYGFGVVAFDSDDDAAVDLYVANDSQGNTLYRNRGDGTFEDVSALSGSAFNVDGSAQGSMGVAAGDYDNDGSFDLAVTNFANDYHTVYRNLGGNLYQDVTFDLGLAVPTFTPLGWGTFFFDADLDGDQDLFFANGHLYVQVDDDPSLHESYRQLNQLFLNEGGRFEEVTGSAGSGFAVRRSSRGAALVDLADDGDLDIVVSNQDARPTLLENRTETSGHWIGFRLVDREGERQALGARVRVVVEGDGSGAADSPPQIRQVRSGGSYMSQNDLRLHFGLGEAARVVRVEVRWPDGTTETHSGLDADAYYLMVRGERPRWLQRGTS